MDPAETQLKQKHILAQLFPIPYLSSLTFLGISPEIPSSIKHFYKILQLSLCL